MRKTILPIFFILLFQIVTAKLHINHYSFIGIHDEEMGSLNGNANNNAKLQWLTANEVNINRFEIERRDDSKTS